MRHLLEDDATLRGRILRILHETSSNNSLFPTGVARSSATSAVLLLLSRASVHQGQAQEPCMVFNKRSVKVKQPGDLCFPGGRIAPGPDRALARLLSIPFFPLARWPYWSQWRHARPPDARRLGLLLAASLREGLEEMRLNPLGITFLGPLPSQHLIMFHRVIYPMAGWIGRQKRFFPNWEVEKIVNIPLRELLNANGYGCYRLHMGTLQHPSRGGAWQDFPCFIYRDQGQREVLWGATYRITQLFLKLIFGFAPPPVETLPVVEGALDDTYLTGAVRSRD